MLRGWGSLTMGFFDKLAYWHICGSPFVCIYIIYIYIYNVYNIYICIYKYIYIHNIGIIGGMENTLHHSKNDQITVIKSHSPPPHHQILFPPHKRLASPLCYLHCYLNQRPTLRSETIFDI